jgi:hypothetical protein
MGVPVSTAVYTAGEYAIGSAVEADIDAIITEMSGNIDADNLAEGAVGAAAIANDAVDKNKIKDGDVAETHMEYTSTGGVKLWRCGPNFIGAGEGGRIARVSKTLDWVTSPQTVTFTYEDDCLDGHPAFTAVPSLLGAPLVTSVSSDNAQILTHRVTVSTSLLITFEFTWTAGTEEVTIQFGVAGPV